MKRREFIVSTSIVAGGLLLGNPSRLEENISGWGIQVEQDNIFAVSNQGTNYKILFSQFPEKEHGLLIQLTDESVGRKPCLDDKIYGIVIINLNPMLDHAMPRIRQLLRKQDEQAGLGPEKEFSQGNGQNRKPWSSILNCYGTALYAKGIIPDERGVAAKEIWPDNGVSTNGFSFNSRYFERVENPMFGDLAVITAAPAFSGKKPEHMGIFILGTRNDAYIFNRVSCGARTQINTLSWYCKNKLTHTTLGPGGLGKILPITKETFYYRKK
jgi:hypothetical protein